LSNLGLLCNFDIKDASDGLSSAKIKLLRLKKKAKQETHEIKVVSRQNLQEIPTFQSNFPDSCQQARHMMKQLVQISTDEET